MAAQSLPRFQFRGRWLIPTAEMLEQLPECPATEADWEQFQAEMAAWTAAVERQQHTRYQNYLWYLEDAE